MRTLRAFPADSVPERRDEALLALVAVGMTAREIAALRVGDVMLFDDSATVRVVHPGGERYVRIRGAERVRDLRAYVLRDCSLRRQAPLFPSRSPLHAITARRLYQRLAQLRATEIETYDERERA